jgi:hypothetical protein
MDSEVTITSLSEDPTAKIHSKLPTAWAQYLNKLNIRLDKVFETCTAK